MSDEEQKILEKLKNSGLKIKIGKKPSQESILEIIEMVKKAEVCAGEHTTEEEIQKFYTWSDCLMLAKLIKSLYPDSEEVKLIMLSSAIPLLYNKSPSFHYVIQFGDYFYDINGQSTLQEMADYTNKNFYWTGMKTKDSREKVDDEDFAGVIKYCRDNIEITESELNIEQ